MSPKPRSAGYFDGWYADQAATPAVAEIMNRHMGFPPDTRAGVVVAEAIPELAEELRLRPGSTLLDLACGRGAYRLLIAQKAGTSLIGVDFSAQALRGGAPPGWLGCRVSGDLPAVGQHGEGIGDEQDACAPGQGDPDGVAGGLLG